MPHIDRTFDVKDREHWLMGYSLAGLFALWAAYESDVFSGIVCCSGSLWFPDWDHYVRDHVIQSKCSVYLSLGGKEEKTKNKVMAAVGDRTRRRKAVTGGLDGGIRGFRVECGRAFCRCGEKAG